MAEHSSRDVIEGPDHYRGYVLSNLIALDMLANTLLGGRVADTISARIGRSHALGGWAARVPWPRWWIEHCYWAADLRSDRTE